MGDVFTQVIAKGIGDQSRMEEKVIKDREAEELLWSWIDHTCNIERLPLERATQGSGGTFT